MSAQALLSAGLLAPILARLKREALEIDEEDVLQRIVGEALLSRDADEIVPAGPSARA